MTIGRSLFLHLIAQRVPEVLKALRKLSATYSIIPEHVFSETLNGPRYLRTRNQGEWLLYGATPEPELVCLPDLLYWKNVSSLATTHPSVGKLEEELTKWAKAFHLEDEWLLDRALQTLYDWHNNPTAKERWGGLPASYKWVLAANERSFTFQDDGWGIEFESWEEFLERIQPALKVHLEEYRQRLVTLAATRGSKPAPRNPKQIHLLWLALYQCLGRSPGDVLEDTERRDMDVSSVTHAIERASKAIGLSLRAPRKGRRAKM